jgi:uncharacterized protein (DUF927 family)
MNRGRSTIEITPELRRSLEAIDACKVRINAGPLPPDEVLQQLEREFVIDSVYHATRLAGGTLTCKETEKILFPTP